LVLRQNFNALGTTNWTTDTNYPENPRNGMQRILDEAGAGTNIKWQIYRDGAWRDILTHLETSFSLARRLEFEFTTASASWQIDHGLGVKPLVQVFDATDLQITPTSVQHVQVAGVWSRIIVVHGAAITGYAIVVG
jgi:hypothetical protein